MVLLIFKRGDKGFGLKATLSNHNDAVNLTGASALFLFGKHEIEANITDAKNGVVEVFFEETHTEETGFFNAEFEVEFSPDWVETFPSDEFIKIRIMKDLGGRS